MLFWVHSVAVNLLPFIFKICCCCSVTQSCPTFCDPMDCSSPGFPVHHYLPEFPQTHWWCCSNISSSVIVSFSSCLQSFPATEFFCSELALCIRWPKYWSLSFSISPFNEHSGLISFRIDWFNLLAVQVPLKSLLQQHSLKASIFWCSALFMVQLSHPYMTTEKIRALTIQTFADKVMSLLFNTLSVYHIVLSCLPKSKCLFNLLAAVTICSDFWAQDSSLSLFALFLHLFAMKWWGQMSWS